MTDAVDPATPEPVDDETRLSARRAEPDDGRTRLSTRRAEPVDDRFPDGPGRLVDDATALAVRRGGPGAPAGIPGPRRTPSPPIAADPPGGVTSPTETEAVDDTLLRPVRPSPRQPAAGRAPAFDEMQARRAAYVPTESDLADRRSPRAPEAAVATRALAASPRSLDRRGAAAPSDPPARRRLHSRARLLLLAAAIAVVAAAVGLVLVLLLT